MMLCSLLLNGISQAQNEATPEERAQTLTESMTEKLNLEESQTETVHQINLKYAQEIEEWRTSNKRRRGKLRALRDLDKNKEAELRQALNEDQYQEYKKLKKEFQQKLRERMKKRRASGDGTATLTPGMEKAIDIEYGSTDPAYQTLDVYYKKEFRAAPVVVWIHGGGWAIGDKKRVHKKIPFFLDHGFVFVAVNYRLSPKVMHPVHTQDVAQALAWIHENISTYAGDNKHLILLGHSSGAHIAALLGTDPHYMREKQVDFSIIKTVIALDGAGYDIPTTVKQGGSMLKKMYLQAFGEDEENWKEASPLHHIQTKGTYPNFLFVTAANRTASMQASQAMSEKLKATGARTLTLHYPEEDHTSINHKLGQNEFELSERVLRFIQKAD